MDTKYRALIEKADEYREKSLPWDKEFTREIVDNYVVLMKETVLQNPDVFGERDQNFIASLGARQIKWFLYNQSQETLKGLLTRDQFEFLGKFAGLFI